MKQIGPVPKKYSDAVWKRFIAACDYFFEQKNKALVDVVADKSEEGLKLVKPGSAEESFLHVILHENIVKYDHTNVITTSSTLTLLDDWINNGAKE